MDEELERFRQLAPLNPTLANQAWRFYLASEGVERGTALDLLDLLLLQHAARDYGARILLPPPPPAACAGPYQVGRILYPDPHPYANLGLQEAEWLRHIIVVGMTGAGKTMATLHLLSELQRHGKPFVVVDVKRTYRDVLQLPAFHDVVVLTVGRNVAPFTFNPLVPPPGTGVGAWLVRLLGVTAHAYFTGEGVEYLLRQALEAVYAESGMLTDPTRPPPTFHDVHEFVRRQRHRGRMGLWHASALRVLGSLTFRYGLGPILNTPNPTNFIELLTRPVVLEVELTDADAVFFIEVFLLWLYHYRVAHTPRETFAHALILEEAHHVLSAAKERAAGAETIMEATLRQIREFGQAVVLVDQEPSKLSASMLANTATKISFSLGHGPDLRLMADSLGLRPDQLPLFHRLGIGHALVKVGARIPSPVLVQFPLVPLIKGRITDADVRAQSLRLLSHNR